jgi:hypothetical protein
MKANFSCQAAVSCVPCAGDAESLKYGLFGRCSPLDDTGGAGQNPGFTVRILPQDCWSPSKSGLLVDTIGEEV